MQMQLSEFEAVAAEGVCLFQEIKLGDITLDPGRILTKEDILNLKIWGIKSVFGAAPEQKLIGSSVAIGVIAAKLCGSNTAFALVSNNLCKVFADQDGFFACSDDRLAKFNRRSPNLILNTVEPYSLVKKGELIAKLELTSAAVSEDDVNKIVFGLSGNTAMLSISEFMPQNTALIYTKFYNHTEETKHFTNAVRKLVKDFPYIEFSKEYNAIHSSEDIANSLEQAIKHGAELVFILGGQKTTDADDIIPKALKSVTDDIICYGVPQAEVSDLVIASKRKCKIVVLPYSYADVDSAIVSKYIKKVIAANKLRSLDFTHPQNIVVPTGSLISSQEEEVLISADNNAVSQEEASVAIVILAAGTGSRSGRNKLLFELNNNKPLFMNSVNAAIKSKASPVFVVTGYQNDVMEEFLEDVDVNVIYNPLYRSGVKTSIDLGLKAVPNFCDGAILLPADMPNVSADFLNELIDNFNKKTGKQVCMASLNGIKNNPILWSKELYHLADIVPENAQMRQVFVEHSDYTKLIEAKKADIVLDINFPSDIDQLTK